MEELIFQKFPEVTFATNKFINVPVILRFEDINLIEIVKEAQLGYTTQIPIYHSDGTYLAKVQGTRMFLTKDGEKAGLKMDKLSGLTACKLGSQTLFEIYHQSGDAFKTQAELYTPEGYFVKCTDAPTPLAINMKGDAIQMNGITMSGNTFVGLNVGLWIRKNGSFSIGG